MFLKDPDAILEYRVDWTDALAQGVGIQASEWRIRPAEDGGLVVVAESADGPFGIAMLGGGQPGHVYEAGNLVTLSDGSVDERSVVIRVGER